MSPIEETPLNYYLQLLYSSYHHHRHHPHHSERNTAKPGTTIVPKNTNHLEGAPRIVDIAPEWDDDDDFVEEEAFVDVVVPVGVVCTMKVLVTVTPLS
jgi:hypothetical protein